VQAAKGLSMLYQGNLVAAVEIMDTAIQNEPNSSYAQVAAARLSMASRNYTKARSRLKAVFATDPDYAPAWNLLGDVETSWFFTQDRQGQKGSYLSLGLGADYQAKASLGLEAPVGTPAQDANAYVADFQSAYIFSDGLDLTVNGAWYEWDSLRYDGSTAFVEAGLRKEKVMLTAKFAHQDPDQRSTINDTTVGIHYFMKGHNLRSGLEYRWGDSRDMALIGIQFML
jgi:tetratricopeptide (TPR) repeat protein